MLARLLLAHGAALAAWVGFIGWEVRRNLADFAADTVPGGSLGNAYHAGRTRVRAAVWLALVLASAGAAHVAGYTSLLSLLSGAAGLGGLLAVLFFVRFNTRLNVARGLSRYYVSFAHTAPFFPDRLLTNRARARYPDGPESVERVFAEAELKRLLNGLLLAGICWYAALLTVAARA